MEDVRKKILLLITQGEIGGAQVYVRDLALNLPKNRFIVTVGHGEKPFDWLDEELKNQIQTKYFRFIKRNINPLFEILGFFELYIYLKKNKFDIIHLNSSKIGVLGSLAAKCAGVKKIIFTCHGWAFDDPRPLWERWLYKIIYKIMAWFTDIIICVSDYACQTGLNIGLNKKKLITIHNNPDASKLNLLKKEEAREFLNNKYKVPINKKIIGTIANFYPTKGLIYLLKAAELLIKDNPNFIFCLIGRGRLEKRFYQFIKENKLEENIFLITDLNNAAKILPAFDLFVLPSVKECLPYVLFEAMFVGLPIVATDVGGNAEVLHYYDNNQYLLTQPRNPEKLAKAILEMIDKRALSEEQVNSLKNKISNNKMIEKTKEIYLN